MASLEKSANHFAQKIARAVFPKQEARDVGRKIANLTYDDRITPISEDDTDALVRAIGEILKNDNQLIIKEGDNKAYLELVDLIWQSINGKKGR